MWYSCSRQLYIKGMIVGELFNFYPSHQLNFKFDLIPIFRNVLLMLLRKKMQLCGNEEKRNFCADKKMSVIRSQVGNCWLSRMYKKYIVVAWQCNTLFPYNAASEQSMCAVIAALVTIWIFAGYTVSAHYISQLLCRDRKIIYDDGVFVFKL